MFASAPVCWFSGTLQTTPIGVVPVLSTLQTAPENSVTSVCSSSPSYTPSQQTSAIRLAHQNLQSGPSAGTPAATSDACTENCLNSVSTSLNMGSFNGQSGTCIGQGSDSSPGSSCGVTSEQGVGASIVPGQASFPASGVYTITTTGSAISSGTTMGTTLRQAQVGASCNANLPTTTVGVGETVNATLTCTAPVSDQGNVSAKVNWGDGTTLDCPGGTPCTRTPTHGPYSDSIAFSLSHSYSAPNSKVQPSYSVAVTSHNDAEGVDSYIPNPQPGAVTVMPIQIPLPSTASVQVKQSQSFSTIPKYDSTNGGVTWALSGTGCTGAACGTLTNVTTTSVTYNAPAIVPSSGTVTLTATSRSTNQPAVSNSVVMTITSLPPPICKAPGNSITGAPGQSVTLPISCTAPPNDLLTATVDWKDGSAPSIWERHCKQHWLRFFFVLPHVFHLGELFTRRYCSRFDDDNRRNTP